MKRKLSLGKAGDILYSGQHEIEDAESFGRACKDAWDGLQRKRFEDASNIGQLMDSLSDDMLAEIEGATIRIEEV